MKEKLVIKNFGPIKDAELELGRFNILIGENATGKSTVAKLLAVFRYFTYIIPDNGNIMNETPFADGLQAIGLDSFVRDDSCLFYDCEHYSVKVENDFLKYSDPNEDIEEFTIPIFTATLIPKSDKFKLLYSEYENIKPKPKPKNISKLSTLGWRIPYPFFSNSVAKVMDNPLYLFTERGLQSIFSLGKGSIQNISDALFNQFAKLDKIAREFSSDIEIEPLNIYYKNDNGRGLIKRKDEHDFLSLFNAASGYQSTTPVVLSLKYYTEINKKSKTFIIEEPELNLFPTAQNKLMKYIVDRIMNYNNKTLITTHSPYVLTSLNNMIYAFQIGEKHPDTTSNVINKKYWLNPKEVSVYMLKEDGTAENIMDADINQIKAEKIDYASSKINDEYDKLLDIDLS